MSYWLNFNLLSIIGRVKSLMEVVDNTKVGLELVKVYPSAISKTAIGPAIYIACPLELQPPGELKWVTIDL